MRLKVYGGTVRHGESSLCHSCRHGMITRGRTLDEEIVQCHAMPIRPSRIPFKVTSCSGYIDERQPTFMQLMEDAWILQPGSKRKPAGFVRASDLREEEIAAVVNEVRGTGPLRD